MRAYVIAMMGGYYTADQGRVRHLNDAQLYGIEEVAKEVITEMGSPFGDTCRIMSVSVTESKENEDEGQ